MDLPEIQILLDVASAWYLSNTFSKK